MIKLLPLLLILASCQDTNSNSSDRNLYGPSELVGSSQFRAAFPIILNRCANCHSSTVHQAWSGWKTEQEWVDKGYVISQNPDQSRFITRITNYVNGNPSNMPEGLGALPDAEYRTLLDWVENIPR